MAYIDLTPFIMLYILPIPFAWPISSPYLSQCIYHAHAIQMAYIIPTRFTQSISSPTFHMAYIMPMPFKENEMNRVLGHICAHTG